ncbi:MAG: hypothetical protein NVS1B11_17200 [Terriglobales bacterium]
MNTTPLDRLELQALEQRNQMHKVISAAKTRVEITRERLEIKSNVRKHLPTAAGIATILALSFGFGFAGLFTKK